ncbi:DUF6350 family protein [Nocardioides zeae]|uniref:DUF6350 family protein n=1 Tax=Nocardioides imazamoxiresistens TaxID=3231893 RepID=A0ABU3PV67_9ACTN|nr:DUF6350 family protein [Nocardioides zeae]MDT9592776.1 DUF6350 family protein [Nocardioides zeae]
MTSVLPPLRRPGAARPPLGPVAVAALGGAAAAASTLTVALGVGVLGWFLSDAGTHGRPSDGLRVGALGWLTGHGSGVSVQGVPLTTMPLGVTLVIAVVCWRFGLRAGEQVAEHGPDAAGVAAGEKDLVVPTVAGVLTAAYVLVAVLTAVVAGSAGDGVSLVAVVGWSLLLAGGVGGAGVAVGSGRAAEWVLLLPEEVRDTVAAAVALLLAWLALGALVLAAGLALGYSEAASLLSQVETGTGSAVLVVGLALLLVPNAVLFGGAYALGPGFSVGAGTLVTPSAVALGPLPLFPLLAGVPGGPLPGAAADAALALPFVLAAVVTVLVHRRRPTLRWEVALARSAASGVLAGIGLAVLARLAGGSAGPGRLEQVGPFVGDVLVHAVVAFTTGAVLAALATTALQRRRADA